MYLLLMVTILQILILILYLKSSFLSSSYSQSLLIKSLLVQSWLFYFSRSTPKRSFPFQWHPCHHQDSLKTKKQCHLHIPRESSFGGHDGQPLWEQLLQLWDHFESKMGQESGHHTQCKEWSWQVMTWLLIHLLQRICLRIQWMQVNMNE